MLTTKSNARLADLHPVKSDSLLALIAKANADTRPEKIDVGVGVYKDSQGRTPVMRSVKAAEKRLWETQRSKSYLGGAGDARMLQLLKPILFGPHAGDERIVGLQTPGGCGALTLGFNLVAKANPKARVLVGTPTWPNHQPIIAGAGLEIVEYPYYDRQERRICFAQMVEAIGAARGGDVVLLHGCCHNPTGADLDEAQWREVVRLLVERQLLPVVDIAYQGLGKGLEEDAFGLRLVIEACDEVVVAQSCDKNFGVYRDRVGALFLKTGTANTSGNAIKHVLQIAREMWSMPPDHGGAVVRTVLDDPELAADWRAEVDEMRARILAIRERLAAAHPKLAFITEQNGMFSMLPVTPQQVDDLRERHAIYMADSGRFNILGMADDEVDRFVAAVVEVIGG
ncbi:aromatic amino acid transaminase [Sphingomonas xanthus]|uniref:Aspartate/tyrosine/aromatic aminotransferase n=1 Tax=Sphingomonas xanthus TaxID=2594473 RepID=A0A516IPR7_9SPHN|nr:amino acid aminotransferase [Sphingomonas xanthus]QDP18913.1 aspartate/tyrosine/aromatic aminotransferase [Sphingomonas xanthus]